MDSDIRLYFDENVEVVVADQMRALGVECVTVRDLNLLGDTDINHLQRATNMGYVLCTYDMDYLRLHAQGVPHSGIIYARERVTSIGDWVNALKLICAVLIAADLQNNIEYLM